MFATDNRIQDENRGKGKDYKREMEYMQIQLPDKIALHNDDLMEDHSSCPELDEVPHRKAGQRYHWAHNEP